MKAVEPLEPSRESAILDEALKILAGGGFVLVYDEKHPEGGGVLAACARHVTPQKVNFLAAHARGLVCIALVEDQMKRLGIPMLVPESPFARRHAFGASIEARHGVTTGISAADRACTILAAARPDASADDIVMPGHIFPIQVRKGGVLIKPGVPEAILDLCQIAGEHPSAALCAVLDDDGEVAGVDYLRRLGRGLGMPLVDVGMVVARRLKHELVVERVAERQITSGFGGTFRAVVYRNDIDGDEHLALVTGDLAGDEPVTVRIHSQCLTGDVFGSARCDCGDQLKLAIDAISRLGRGVIVYMHQEGRGIGLANKIRAYALQDRGRDTVEANLELGFKEDLRDYGITAQILRDLGIHSVRLLTNNPQKVAGLQRYGVKVVERCPIQTQPHEGNIAYLRTKKRKLGHLLDGERLGGDERS